MRRSLRRRTLPRSAFSRPSSTRTSVVLPAPLGPISVTISRARDVEVDVEQKLAAAAGDADPARRYQRVRVEGRRRLAAAFRSAAVPAARIVSMVMSSRQDRGCTHAPRALPLARPSARQSFFGAQVRQRPETSTNFTRGWNVAPCARRGRSCRRCPPRRPPARRCISRRRGRSAGARCVVEAAAGEVGVLAFEAVDDAGLEQRVDGAVDGDRREPRALLGEARENVVGADRRVGRRDLLEHVLAQLGEAQVLLGERLARPLDCLGETAVAQDRPRPAAICFAAPSVIASSRTFLFPLPYTSRRSQHSCARSNRSAATLPSRSLFRHHHVVA